MSQKFPVLLFAAGRGTRMGALGDARPKCLIEVAGKPLFDHALALTDNDAISRRVANAHYKADMIFNHLQGRDVAISHEIERALETGGGLRHALPMLGDGPVVTLNTDAVWSDDTAISALAAAWQPHMDALLLVVPARRAIGHLGQGDFDIAPDQSLTRGRDYIYTGVQILCTDHLKKMPEDVFSLNTLWDHFLSRGTAYGLIYDGLWCDVGQPDSIAHAEQLWKDHRHV